MSNSSNEVYEDRDTMDISVLSVITSDPAGDTAVQLFEFIPDTSRNKSTIKLNDHVLKSLEDQAGNRPISVISICGQSSQGNSFLFSHIAKAFEGIEKNDANGHCHTDFSDRPVQLNELKFGGHQSSPLTQGIWISRRPFIVKNTENREVAVLLMYTQGTDEQFTVSDDVSAIIGLSILMASVTIVNFYDNLQEDFLAALNTYVQYLMLALENPQPACVPFQQLKFLVQDWKMPLSYPYGKEGGMKFIKDALMVQPGQLLEAAHVRESIQMCFEPIDCFLMPHAGDSVISHDSLTGSGSSGDLDPIYLENLVEFIRNLTCKEAIHLKRVLGKEININELRTYLEGYLQVFNEYDGPSAQHLWKATLDAKVMSFVNSAVETFLKFKDDQQAGRNYMSEDEMMGMLQLAEKQAVEYFQRKTNFESNDNINQKKASLRQKLDIQKTQLTKQNTEILNIVTGVISLTTTLFRKLLDEAVGFNLGTDTFNFYDKDEIEKATANALTTAISYFKEKLKDYSAELIESEEKTLRQILTSTEQSHKENNEFRRLAAHGKMVTTVDDHATSYQSQLEDKSLANKSLEFDSIPDLGKVKDDILISFDKRKKHGKADFHTMYRESLEKRLDGAYLLVKTQHNNRLQEMQSNVNNVIMEEGETHLKWLQGFMKIERRSNDHSDKERERINKAKIEKTIQHFNETLNPYPEEHPNYMESFKRLENHLNEIYKTAVEKAAEENKRVLKSYQNAATKSVEFYLGKMRAIATAKEFLLGVALEENHNRVRGEAYQIFDQAEKLGDLENLQSFRQIALINCIEQHYWKFCENNDSKKEVTVSRAKNVVQDCKKMYEETMARTRARTTRQLEDLHRKAKQTASQELAEKCPGQEYPIFIEEYKKMLDESIEKTFKEYNETFGLRLREESTVTKELLLECMRLYNDEMQKHVKNDLFVLPQEVLECHKKAKELVIGKLKEKRPLTRNHLTDMTTAMEELFRKYNVINDMKLNINKMGTPPVIGIDLGTTYSCVGVYYIDKVIIIPFGNGDLTIPSYVSYEKNGSVVKVGDCAKESSYANPENTIHSVKRIIGRSWDDEKLQKNIGRWAFDVVNDEGLPKIKLTNGTILRPEQVSAEVLIKCRESAESFLKLAKGSIKYAVVTVPAYFTDGQRLATKAAAELAGLEVLDLLNEPTAAAIAYYQERLDTWARRVLIFDMGGGTHDVAVLDMETGKIESLGCYGDPDLGGGDFDNEMMEYCCNEFKKATQIDILSGKNSDVKTERDDAKREMTRILLDCEKKKKQLSEAIATDVQVDFVKGKVLKVEITREKFEKLNDKYFQMGIQVVEEALKKTGVSKESFDDVVVVGGSSKIPKVKKLLTDYFKGQALNRTIPPDHAVAYGAAIKAAILNGKKIKERSGLDTLRIQEVIPFSLGVEVVTKELSVILVKNSKIPVKHTKDYYTTEDNQTEVRVSIYEGEDFKVAANNKLLGTFTLTGIPAAPRGHEPIDITMEINGMGILEVSAVIRSTKGKGDIVIKERRLGMSKAEVERILRQARNAA